MKKLFLTLLTIIALASCSDNDDPIVTYTVTFETEGGTPVPSVQTVEEGSTVTAPSTNPSKAGYVFLFWHSSGASTAYNFQTPVKGNITLYAKWQEETTAEYWQVAWELNGGSWPSDDNHVAQVLKGGTLAEPNAPTKTSSTFEGWYKEVALTTKVNFPYDVSAVTSNFTLYAKWESEKPVDKGIQMVASSYYHYFTLEDDGTLYAFGHNKYGELGSGNNSDLHALAPVATGVAKVYAGKNTTFIVKTDGSIWGTGLNASGQLGLGDEVNRNSFTSIPIDNVKEIAPGISHTFLLKNDGSLWAIGSNFSGFLGVGDRERRNTFTATNLTSDVVAVSAESNVHTLALKKDGTVWGCGYNNAAGLLGVQFGDLEYVPSFTQIYSGAKGIATGRFQSFIIMNDGTVFASGKNEYGQAGVGSANDPIKTFTQVVDESGAPLTNAATIVTEEGTSSYALKTDGSMWSTGNNNYDQLGISDGTNRDKFTKVATGVKSMTAGRYHNIALKNDGTIINSGHVNPYDQLNGSASIVFKVNDSRYYQYITNGDILDSRGTHLLSSGQVTDGSSGFTASVKPGTYTLEMYASNGDGVKYLFSSVPIAHNEVITVTYEYVSTGFGSYRWVLTRSTK